MKVSFEDATLFRRYIDGLAALVDEAQFLIDDKGMSLKATDPSQISLVDFSIPKKAFRKFEVEGATKLGVDLNYLNQIVGRAKAGDSIELSLSEDSSKILIVFAGGSKRSFSIPLLDLTVADLPLPRIEFDAEIKLRADALQNSFKDADLISTHINLSVENDAFVVRANSSKGNLENIYSSKEKSVISLKAQDMAHAMFPLDYLESIVKATASDTEVTVKLKTNAPVEISYSLGEAKFTFFLAPRIESE